MHVTIVAYERSWAMSLMTVKDLLHIASILESRIYGEQSISACVASVGGVGVSCAGGVTIVPDCALAEVGRTDLVVIPAIEGGGLSHDIEGEDDITQWIVEQSSMSVPILALSTGVALLGRAGLLDGRTVSTHWAFLPKFRKLYPKSEFISHASFMESSGLFTAGTLLGGFDAILYHLGRYRGERFSGLCAAHGLIASPEQIVPILPGRRNHTDMKVSQIQDWIEEHHCERLSIGRAVENFGLSESGLKRRLKKATGLSFVEYLQAARIEKSKRLLLSTSLSVRDISQSIGYENQSFFIRVFKKLTGTTPGEYRSEETLSVDLPA